MDSLRSFGDKASEYAKSNPKTMKYLMIGLAVLAVIVIGWFIYKKMKKENFAPNCQDPANCVCATGKCAKRADGKIDCVADRNMKSGCRCQTCPQAAASQVQRASTKTAPKPPMMGRVRK